MYILHPLLFLLVCSCFTSVSTEPQECRDASYCQNGGTCIVNSGVPASKRCSSDEVFHDNACYSFVRKSMQWNEAARTCSDRDASLPLPETPEDQRFLSTYIQGILISGLNLDRSTSGIWTAIRSKANGSTPVWVSFPGSYLVKNTFWKPGEPNLYPDWNEVCVSLQSDTLYLSWQSQSCDVTNYAICQRKLTENEEETIPQCSCSSGFTGQRCEERTSGAPSDTSSLQQMVCATKPLSFSCPNGGSIVVDYASFGAVEGYNCCDQCAETMGALKQTCSNRDSLQTLVNRCQGLPFCEITDVAALFPETPCPVKEELQLQYRMRCVTEIRANCPSGAFYTSGRCFSVISKKVTEKEASAKCREEGGQLPTSITEVQEEEIARQASKISKTAEFWIGLEQTPGGPAWSDGNPISYTPPGSDLAQNLGCTVLSVSPEGSRWVSKKCDANAYFLCQYAPNGDERPKEKAAVQTTTEGTVFKGDPNSGPPEDIFGPAKYCPEQTARGVHFPKTRVCTEAVVDCPDPENIIGTVVRLCNCKTGKWDAPNTSNCTHKWVAEVRGALDRGDPAEDVSRQLADNLNKTVQKDLFGGDILGSVSLSNDALALAKNQYAVLTDRNERYTRASDFTYNLGASGDNLLAPVAVPVWGELDDARRIDHASTLMSVLEQSALLLADYTVTGKSQVNYEHWAMEIEVKQPETFNPATTRSFSPVAPGSAAPMDDAEAFSPFGAPTFGGQTQESVSFNLTNSPTISLPSLSTLKTSSINSSPQVVLSQAQFSPEAGAEGAAASALDRSRLHLGYYVFMSFGSILSTDPSTVINSHVIGAAVDDATRSLQLPPDQPATFNFVHLHQTGVSNPRCVYWDLETKQWSGEGCQLISTSRQSSQCACTHLTSFAILMDVAGRLSATSGAPGVALDVISTVGCALSIVCLSISLVVFTCFRSLYNLRNTIHRNLCFCLLVAELTFVIGIDRTGNRTGCSIVAVILHFFFLAAFCWMLLEGYQLYMMLIQVFEPSKTRVLLYYIFCYGFPAVLVAVTAGVAWNNYGTDNYCWINTSTPTIWAFVVPVLIVILANIAFLFIALRVVLSVKSRDRTTSNRVFGWLKGSATLLCLLGITWLFGFLTAVKGGTGTVFAWIFTILNCTQGVFIFVLHVLLNEKVRLVVVRWIRTGICCLPESTSAYNSRSYLSSRQRILNMMKSQQNSRSAPSTASTDDKEKQLTPTSKTSEWLKQISQYQSSDYAPTSEGSNDNDLSTSSDPRGSQVIEVSSEPIRVAPVKRKKFPLEMGEQERRSTQRSGVVVEHF